MLAAINEVAGGLQNKKVNEKQQSELLSNAGVSQGVKRDLVSNASRAADLRDFEEQLMQKKQTADQFEHGKTLLNNKAPQNAEKVEEDLRSLRSEFDYGSKKKFVDVLGNVTQNSHLNRLRAEHAQSKQGDNSIKSTSYKS